MKKLLIVFAIPVMVQLILLPYWFVKVGYQHIDASIISIFVSILVPIYLLVINLVLKGYRYGVIRIHFIMLAVVILGVLLGMMGWSRFDIYKMWHPDTMTAGFNKFFLQFGGVLVFISFIASYIIKSIKE